MSSFGCFSDFEKLSFPDMEQENDLLVCGDCQTSFALHDIVHFIKHKKKCCDKENLISDGSCRKDSSNGGSHNNDDDDDDDKDDDVDSEVESDDGDEGGDDKHNENEDDDDDGGDKKKKHDKDVDNGVEKEKSKDVHRKPLKQKQVVDAESNTTHSEPSRFVCETCRSTYTSAWGLLQHAQKEHGMKIYTSPSSSSSSSTSTGHPTSSTPGPNSASPIDLVMSSSSRSVMGRRPASSSGSGGCESPFPVVHPPNPFASPFRLPLADGRLPHPSSLSPFSRPSLDFDLINDTRLRPQYLGRGLHGLEHSPFYHSPFDRSRAHLPQSVDEFYSMRLRQLASSPGQAQVKPFLNSLQAQVPPVSVTPTSKSERPSSADAPTSASPRLSSLANALAKPQKPKACEFCGKTFRFKSNLIVHRRSHTGEKPFKCPMCPHACTQQSKLKRHMKTHSAKSENTEGETSPGGTPYPKADDFEDDDEDEEEEEEEELEGEEDENIEEEMNEEERAVLESMKTSEVQAETEPGEIRQEGKGIKRELSDSKDDVEDDCEPSDLSMKKPRSSESLLSEVMKNTGLNSIQRYSEAYQAALAESQEKEKLSESDKASVKSEGKDEAETPRSSSPKSPRLKSDKALEKDDKKDGNDHLFLGGTDLLGKSDKKNPSSPASAWNASVESLGSNPIESAASMFSRMQQSWFHPDNPVRFFLPGYPARFPPVHRENHGLNLSPTTTNSALSSTSPTLPTLFKSSANNSRGSSSAGNSPTSSLLLPSNGGGNGGGGNNSISPLKKESRRNDTCEYCGKIFKNCSNLTVHRRSHTGEKPYKCALCSYACAQSSKLTRHMKTHGRQGKDVYTCKFCNMPFSVPSTLEKHMRKCVENRQARIMAADAGDLSSEASNGEVTPTPEAFPSPHLVN